MEALGEAMYENCTFLLSCLGAGGAGGGSDGGPGRGGAGHHAGPRRQGVHGDQQGTQDHVSG
jgi:hypothetical protein